MANEEISNYSDLTAGHYEGRIFKREPNHKWQPFWCVLYGRQLTFYEDEKKSHIIGQIEIQPGSSCDKARSSIRIPTIANLFHRDHWKRKKHLLKLKTKKGTHLFTYENVNEQTRWHIAMNNASQINQKGVRLSWIPTPFSAMTTVEDIKDKRQSLTRTYRPATKLDCNSNSENDIEDGHVIIQSSNKATKVKCKHEEFQSLISKSQTRDSPHAYTNPNLQKEVVTTL